MHMLDSRAINEEEAQRRVMSCYVVLSTIGDDLVDVHVYICTHMYVMEFVGIGCHLVEYCVHECRVLLSSWGEWSVTSYEQKFFYRVDYSTPEEILIVETNARKARIYKYMTRWG